VRAHHARLKITEQVLCVHEFAPATRHEPADFCHQRLFDHLHQPPEKCRNKARHHTFVADPEIIEQARADLAQF
jgi:hypothetical protein